jgi:hypothetical protein
MTLTFSTPGSRASFPDKELLVPGMRYVSMLGICSDFQLTTSSLIRTLSKSPHTTVLLLDLLLTKT